MKNKYIGIEISPQIKVLVGIEIEGSDKLYSVEVFKDGNWTISDFDCVIVNGDEQVFDENCNLIRPCKYYDMHVFWSRKDGYSVFMKVDNTDYAEEELLDEEALLNIAMGRGLLTPEDANQVDYIEEISEQEYNDYVNVVQNATDKKYQDNKRRKDERMENKEIKICGKTPCPTC